MQFLAYPAPGSKARTQAGTTADRMRVYESSVDGFVSVYLTNDLGGRLGFRLSPEQQQELAITMFVLWATGERKRRSNAALRELSAFVASTTGVTDAHVSSYVD